MAPNVDGFNPYQTWLGLAPSLTQPNYYQLLGIAQQERDPKSVAAAAERALIRVRGARPGSRSTQWAQLLDEINAARTCLMDPARRAQYDRQLATPGAAAATPFNRPAPRSAGPMPGAVPMGGNSPSNSAGPQARAVPMSAPTPTASPTASPIGGNRAGSPITGTPVGFAGPGAANVPTGIPVGSTPGVTTTGTAGSPAVVTGKGQIAGTRRASRSMTSPIIIAAAACMILFGIILLLVVLGGDSSKKSGTQSQPLSRNRTTQDASRPRPRPEKRRRIGDRSLSPTTEYSAKRDLTGAERPGQGESDATSPGTNEDEPWTMPAFPKLDTSLEPKPKPDATLPTVPPATTPTADPSGPGAEPVPPTSQGAAPEAPGPQPSDEPDTDPNTEPNTEIEPPAAPEMTSPEPAAQASPEDRATLAAAMKAARTAALNGKFDVALNNLKNVASLPKSPEHQAMHDRLNLMVQYADNFRSACRDSIAALEAGDEIEVSTSGAVGVVGKSATSITVRVKGANRTYAIETLPPGLAVAIADTWLSKEDAVSLVMKGAYLATLKGADAQQLAKARQWLQEASKKDPDFADLEKVLDDKYDF